jgi:uncharacterized protein
MTGQVVFAEDYFPRPKDEERVWRRLKSGGHLLILAPRRVGKTSLLRHLESHPQEGYVFLYVIVQSCNSEHEFYKEILEKLYSSEFINRLNALSRKGKEVIASILRRIDGIEIAEAGSISFKDSDYKLTCADLEKVISQLKLEHKLIIVLDEYPDVLEKIIKLESKQAAIDLLTATRSLCQNKAISQKVQFIFTGSIGLDTLAQRLGSSSLINATDKVAINPLTKPQALEFIEFLTNNNDSQLTISQPIALYLLKKVDWLMPYYIAILWEMLEDVCSDDDITEPTQIQVDQAFERLFNNHYKSTFSHWAERLQRFEKDEAKLAKAILDKLSAVHELSFNEIHNIFQELNYQQINGNYILDCLEHDGYVFEHQPKSFKFTSPMLKEWWSRYADRTL